MSDHVLDRLSAFLDQELPAREQSAVEGHLRDCSACAAHLDLLRSVDAEACALPVSVPDGYFDTLPGRIRGRLEKTPRPVRRVPVWTWAVAAALVLAVVTPLTMQQSRMAMPEPKAVPMPPASYPAPAAAETAPEAGVVARSAPESPVDTGAAEKKAKDLFAEAQKELADADRGAARSAAASPAPSVRLEARSHDEADKLQYAHDAAKPDSAAPPVAQRRRAGPGGPYSQQQAPLQAPAETTFAEAPGEAPVAAAPTAGERRANANEASRDEEFAKREDQVSRPQAAGGSAAAGRVSSAVASSDEKIFRLLQDAAAPATLASLRERREAWRAFARDFPSSPRSDEARVRVIETGTEAWRVGGESVDLSRVREDAAAYLARGDAAQASRVRALLETLPRP